MDNNRRRQNDGPQYSASTSRYGSDQSQARGRGYGNTSSDQYRSSQMSTSPTTAGRGVSGSSTYGYYPEAHTFPTAIPSNTIQYQPEYTADQRQQQSYTGYGSNMMYGVNQAPRTAVYDSTPQFQSQQPAAMQILSDVATPYFPATSETMAGPAILQHQPSSNSSAAYQPSVTNFSQSITMSGMEQAAAPTIDQDGVVSGGLDEAYSVYQDALRQIFYNIQEGRLTEASISVLDVSDWLLTNVVRLGLTGDEEMLHNDRVKLWTEFNNAWLTLFQKQKDMTLEAIQTGIAPRPPQSLVSSEYLERMSKDLVRLSDGVEKHGLVDYQLGIWEENIMDILLECLDLLESPDDENENTNPGGRKAPP